MRWLCFWQPPCLFKRVIVNFTHNPDEAIEGVLFAYRWGWLTLKDCAPLKAGRPVPTEKLPGEIVIHRDQIAFLQVAP
jgi:hypothetical protein